MAGLQVKYTHSVRGTEFQLKIEVLSVSGVPNVGSFDPNIFVFRAVSTGAQYSHIATLNDLLKYPSDSEEILPKNPERFFRQSQVVLVRGTKDELVRIQPVVGSQIDRLIRSLNAELDVVQQEIVNYGDEPVV